MVVTSFDPLRVYLYDDGLVRFATHDYSEPKPGHKKHVKDRFMHLTNYSINKSSDEFVQPSKAGDTNARGQAGGDGSKWTVRQLWSYMRENNKHVDVDKLIAEIKDVCVKTLIAAEPTLVSRCNHSRMPRCGSLCVTVRHFASACLALSDCASVALQTRSERQAVRNRKRGTVRQSQTQT